jgi:hypothetical protein
MLRSQKTVSDLDKLRLQFQQKQLEFKQRYSSAVKQHRSAKSTIQAKGGAKKPSECIKPARSQERCKSIDIFDRLYARALTPKATMTIEIPVSGARHDLTQVYGQVTMMTLEHIFRLKKPSKLSFIAIKMFLLFLNCFKAKS